jgi:hypothetical protein
MIAISGRINREPRTRRPGLSANEPAFIPADLQSSAPHPNYLRLIGQDFFAAGSLTTYQKGANSFLSLVCSMKEPQVARR